jgi:D-amino peptidase
MSVLTIRNTDASAGKRIFIVADMEGIAGVVSRDQLDPKHFEYEAARKWMTEEVHSAVQGAVAGGATAFVVADSHGNGENLLLDGLPANVEIVRSQPRPLGMMEGIQVGHYDGAFLIGFHAGATNSRGILAHTFSNPVFRDIQLNGKSVSEGEWCAAVAAEYGVPILLFSGDDAAVAEARAGIKSLAQGVTVKRALGTFSAMTMTPHAADVAIKTAAETAVRSYAGARPEGVAVPVHVAVTFRDAVTAEVLSMLPGMERTGSRVISYTTDSMTKATMVMEVFQDYGGLASSR